MACSSVATVHLRGHQLKLGLPSAHDGLLVGSAGLIIQDLEVHWEAAGRETHHDGVVGSNAVGVSFCFECRQS